jgi:gliding motility-associated-like protein
MERKNKHIKLSKVETFRALQRATAVLIFAFMFIQINTAKAQVISNSGATINLAGGVVVQTDTVANQSGLITNNGIFNLNGDYRNEATTEGNGTINLAGSWLNTGTFNADNSTVQFNGTDLQTITKTGGEYFYNLIINNSGISGVNRIILSQQITVSNVLSLSQGNIDPAAHTVFLTNSAISALNYTSTTGSRIIGKFQRGVNSLGTYLFPVGTLANYNPLNITNNTLTAPGTVLSEFVAVDPGDLGLPLTDLTSDDSVEVYQTYDDGYWNLVSDAFSVGDFDVNIDGAGFTTPIQDITKVLKRDTGNDWSLDGTHKDAIGTVGFRNHLASNISPTGSQFALAFGRPKIWTHPEDTAVCDGFSASFTVYATGRKPLTYQWQVNTGSGWVNLNNGGIYSGATSKTLQLSATNLAMDGYQYRVIVRDARGNPNTSNAATLTVNPIPIALATPQIDTLCDYGTTNVVISTSNGVVGTTFVLEVIRTGVITGTETTLIGGNLIQHTLHNPTDVYDYVEYRIIPTGPNTTYCVGVADTVRIYVNPTPRAIATVFRDTICNDTYDRITLTSPSVFASGATTFDYTSVVTGGITGNSADTDLPKGYDIEDLLHNPTTEFNAAPHVVTYTVTPKLTSYLGCSNGPTVIAEVTVHPTPYTFFSYVDNVHCYQEANGEATVTAFNTSPNIFTYQWNDPLNQTTAYADSLDVGTYIVTVTDNQQCVTYDTVTITQPDLLVASIDSSENVTCFGWTDGWAYASAEGGNGGYNYLWTPGDYTTSYIKDIGGNQYTVKVTDIRGCSDSTIVSIRESAGITASVSITPVRCYGENNGVLSAFAPQANSFDWYSSETSTYLGSGATISNLSPGEYKVVIADERGCSITIDKNIIEQPDSLIATVTNDTISCAGSADGITISTVSGGNTLLGHDYMYNWSTGETTSFLFDLSGGQYVLTVSDWLGCVATDTAFIYEPPLFESFITKTDVTCFGDNNGTIELTASGGNGDYHYEWNTTDTTTILTDLLAGTYTVTISDRLGCEIYDTTIITEPDEIIATINKTDIQCFGFNNGTANVDITGGNGGYSITWSNGSTEDTITGLVQGTYYVDIVDINGCDASDTVEISQPTEIQNNLQKTNITCFGFNNGQISVNPVGGITPYTYSWSHDTLITVNSLTDLGPGPYTVYVTDSNDCVIASDVELTQPDPLIASINKTDITCFGDDDGSIAIDMYGGTPAYNYTWSNGTTASSEMWLGKGFYSINITDAQDCKVDTIVEIVEPDKLIIEPVLGRSTCPDVQDGSIELNITGGVGYYSIFWSNGNTEENLYDIRSGKYTVFIYDENSCELKADIILPSGKDYCIDIPSAFSPNKDGQNDLWSIYDMEELYPNATIEVFDRRGVRVFYSKGYSADKFWDGTYQGRALPMDSYYYIIYLKNGLGRISGTVTIIR